MVILCYAFFLIVKLKPLPYFMQFLPKIYFEITLEIIFMKYIIWRKIFKI